VSETTLYAVADGVATITLNRPERLNAMTFELIDEVLARLEEAASDPMVRVVVLTGAGRAFCAGGDLSSIEEHQDRPVSIESEISAMRARQRSSELLHGMPKVTVAAINGACVGAGLSWACAADIRIASSTAVFRTAFLSAGMTGDFGGSWTLTRLVGTARARELYLLNEKIDARRALELGLVHRVVEPDELAGSLQTLTASLAGAAPKALAGIKANLNDALRLEFAAMLDTEAERHIRASKGDEALEAARAFLEKRAPRFV